MIANVVEALTLRWQTSDLLADVERFEMEADISASLILSWNATGTPDGYTPVAGGAAFLRNDARTKAFQQSSKPDPHPQKEYGWCDTAHQGMMALIVVFPEGHGPGNAAQLSPAPFSGKMFGNRIAVFWALTAGSQEVRWHVAPRTPAQNMQAVLEINERAARDRGKDKQHIIGTSGPEDHIRVATENVNVLRRQYEDLPKNQKKARKDALYAWNSAARECFSACITAFFTDEPRTRYTGSAHWAADWLHGVYVHYAKVNAESATLSIDLQELQPNLLKFKELQRVVAESEEAAARQLRDDFVRVGLPTFGFDEVLLPPGGRKHAEDVPKKIWIPALVFASVLLVYFFVLTSRSQPLDDSRQDIANKMFALLAGFSALFLGGTALFALKFPKNKGVRVAFSATAGIAVFAFVWSYPPYWLKAKTLTPVTIPSTGKAVSSIPVVGIPGTGVDGGGGVNAPLPHDEVAKLFETKYKAEDEAIWAKTSTGTEVFDRQAEFDAIDHLSEQYNTVEEKINGILAAMQLNLRGGALIDGMTVQKSIQDVATQGAELAKRTSDLHALLREHAKHRDPQVATTPFTVKDVPYIANLPDATMPLIDRIIRALAEEQQRQQDLRNSVADELEKSKMKPYEQIGAR